MPWLKLFFVSVVVSIGDLIGWLGSQIVGFNSFGIDAKRSRKGSPGCGAMT